MNDLEQVLAGEYKWFDRKNSWPLPVEDKLAWEYGCELALTPLQQGETFFQMAYRIWNKKYRSRYESQIQNNL